MNESLLKENNSLLQRLVYLLEADRAPVVGKKEAKTILGIDDDKKFYFLIDRGFLKPYDFGRDKYDKKELQKVHEMIKAGVITLPKKSK